MKILSTINADMGLVACTENAGLVIIYNEFELVRFCKKKIDNVLTDDCTIVNDSVEL